MLIKPNIQVKRATDITLKLLKDLGVNTLILDVDNTLSIKKGRELLPGIADWLDNMRKAGIKLIILSNAKPKRMSGFAEKMGLPFVAFGLKPLPFGFFRAAKKMGSRVRDCAIIGDQLFTDMLGGNLSLCKTVLTCPVEPEQSFVFRIKRGLERKLLRLYKLECDF